MNEKYDNTVETLIYVLIAVIGVTLIIVSAYQANGSFIQNLFMSLGTNMAVVTVVFLIFKAFRKNENKSQPPNTAKMETQELPPLLRDKVLNEKSSAIPSHLHGKLANRASPRVGDIDRGYYGGDDERK